MNNSPTLKAYQVNGNDYSVIRFAKSAVVARREGADELDIDFRDVQSCCRVPGFDHFAPGPVPKRALLESGWWFECTNCEAPSELKTGAVFYEENIFCSAECRRDFVVRRIERRRKAWGAA